MRKLTKEDVGRMVYHPAIGRGLIYCVEDKIFRIIGERNTPDHRCANGVPSHYDIAHDDMLFLVLPRHGEECWVSDSGSDWAKSTFNDFSPYSTYQALTPSIAYKKVLDVRRESPIAINITVMVNGEKVSPSTISAETWAKLRQE